MMTLTQTALSRPSNIIPLLARAPSSLASIFDSQPVETFDPGRPIFWQNDPAKHVFEISDGLVRVFKILSDGRRVITGFLYPGDLVGISFLDRYLYGAEAIISTKVRRFSRRSFQIKMDQSPDLRPSLFARLSDEMAAAQEQMILLATKTAEERVCTFLLLTARRDPARFQKSEVNLPMTRQDIGDYLGLTIETVSRTFSNLAGRDTIVAIGRHCYHMRVESLLALAGEIDACHAEARMHNENKGRRAVGF